MKTFLFLSLLLCGQAFAAESQADFEPPTLEEVQADLRQLKTQTASRGPASVSEPESTATKNWKLPVDESFSQK